MYSYFRTRQSINLMLALEKKITELESHLETIERRFVLGEIDKSLYTKYKDEFDTELVKVNEQIENSQFNLSNFEKAIDRSLKIALKLPEIWRDGNLEIKKRIQKSVFPEGIRYDHKNHRYRTTRVNMLFGGIPLIEEGLAKNKNGTSANFKNLSRLVPGAGLEPARPKEHRILSPACLPIPPSGHLIYLTDKSGKLFQ